MKGETKLFLGIILATIVVIAGGIFLFSKPPVAPKPVDATVLVPANSYIKGPPNAPVTLVEFGDFQCPACGAYHPLVNQLLREFKSDMRFIFRNFPLTKIHKNGYLSSQGAEAAGIQGKYWEMYDILYEKQKDWSTSDSARDLFIGYAKELKLDTLKFAQDIDSEEIKNKIEKDIGDGNSLSVDSTPTFYLNGEKLTNPGSVEDFRTLIKAAILKAPKPSISSSQDYHVHFNMAVAVNNVPIDFTQAKYQSSEDTELNEYIHFHDGNGEVVHIHKRDVPLGSLFSSFGMSLTSTCLVTDAKESLCTANGKTLKMYVNGNMNTQFEKYVPMDLDRILITYGAESETVIGKQIQSVSDTACIYSEICPERGTPPTENCVGGLGTGCKD